MLFSKVEELNHIIPTSKVAKIDALLSQLEAEEMKSLYPLVGKKVLDKLTKDYTELSQADSGGIWAKCERNEEDTVRVTILRTAQEVLLYSFLANHSAILQNSFNLGGGWNSPSTGDYEALDSKANERLDKDLWHSARRAKENLLLFLEMDAREKQVYTELWKESDYYYQHSELLFTTASELHPLYINLGDCPHIAFQQYVSILHDCQDGYIAGTIGYTLLQELIDRKYNAADKTEDSTSEEEQPISNARTNSPQTPEQPSTDEAATAQIWKSIDRHIRMALANFANYEKDGAKHDHLRNRGQSQLSIATRIILQNYEVFHHLLEDSPLYRPDFKKEEEEDAPKKECPKPQPPCQTKHCGTVFSLLN